MKQNAVKLTRRSKSRPARIGDMGEDVHENPATQINMFVRAPAGTAMFSSMPGINSLNM